MSIVKEWTTLELIEFMNSYNRVYKKDVSKAKKYQPLYVLAFAELHSRSSLLSILY